eukprot:281384_1
MVAARGGHGHGGAQPTAPPDFSHWKAFKKTLPHLWPKGEWCIRFRVIISFLLMGVQRIVELLVPIAFAEAVARLTPPNPTFPIAEILVYGAVRFGSDTLGEIRSIVFARVGAQMEREIALQVFNHLQNLSLNYHLNRKTGSVLRSVSRGASSFATVLRVALFSFAPVIFQVLIVCIYLLVKYKWPYALITFLRISFYVTYSFVTTEWRNKFRRVMNEKDNEFNQKATDALLNFETVKYFNAEKHEAERYDKALIEYREANILSQQTLSLLNSGQSLIIAFGVSAAMYLSAGQVVDGSMAISDFVLIQGFILTLYVPLGFLGTYYRMIKQNLVDVENMFQILSEDDDISDAPDAREMKLLKAEIVFDNVSFSYSPNQPILRDVSFRVGPGEKVAIVGPSGAGKSTIARLLYRFYDVSSGSISIDSQDIRSVTQRSLRREIGIVPQECVLFNDTIGYNIGYGLYGSGVEREATEEEIISAAESAKLMELIRKNPKGLDLMVGERGLRLSGGEKQRVAIARAILKAPRIMVFDEATSSLDIHTEQGILSELEALSEGRSSITIAHRLSTIVKSDRIIVLMGGRIVEQGSHEELMQMRGQYFSMWERQQASARLQAEIEELEEEEARAAKIRKNTSIDENESKSAPEVEDSYSIEVGNEGTGESPTALLLTPQPVDNAKRRD